MRKILLIAIGSLLLMTACASRTEKEFMVGCMHEFGNEDICSCTYDKLVDIYGESKLERINSGEDEAPDNLQSNVGRLSLYCLEENS